ncbi:Transposase [Shigella boydii ATCC 9905]|nr:Transposase [Shigella boydii ATCC 9905]
MCRRCSKKHPDIDGDNGLGRSRGGFGTKIHLATDGSGLPLNIVLSPGQAHESQFAQRLLDGIGVQRQNGSMKPTPLPLTALFASAISDFCCAGKLKSPLLDTAVICSFCSSPADFARITLAPLESVNDVRFSASVSLLLISACGSASTVNDKFLPGKM